MPSFIPIWCILCILATLSETNAAADITPRLQWNANNGYCGEVSLISAGLYFGQYCSQYEARALASPGVQQSKLSSQLLLGVNDMKAARAMRLDALTFNTVAQTTDSQYVDWVQAEVSKDRPVIIAVFMNYYKFYGLNKGGDNDYDHIVPVLGVTTNRSEGSRLYWSDNGLWAPGNNPPYRFDGVFTSLFKSRSQANAATAPIYSLNNNKQNRGLSVFGVMDANKDTIRVKLATNVTFEKPAMKDGQNTRPKSMPLELTATVQIPDQKIGYNLYLYSAFTSVPTSKFNGNAAKAAQIWKIPANSGATFTVKVNVQSSNVAVFRAVRATAP